MLPFVLLRDRSIVLAGMTDASMIGFDPVRLSVVLYDPADVEGVVSVDPVAVYYGIKIDWAEALERLVANRAPRYAPRGARFQTLPEGVLSGFPVAERVIRRHRMELPTEDAVRVSALFAVSTVRTPIEQAERSFDCFGDLYRQSGRTMPDLARLRNCFVGLQNTKTAVFAAVSAYTPLIRRTLNSGYRDRALRRVLALETELPEGLGLAKLSFTLALLGQDTICLDGRLLGVMFPKAADRLRFEKLISKQRGHLSEKAVDAYEAAEDAFLEGNPHYNRKDAIGRARAQWMSWEGVGGKGAEHRVWLNLLPSI